MKLTKELVNTVLRKRVVDCQLEELSAILYLLGCTVKEFDHKDTVYADKSKPGYVSTSFEIHHRYFFIMEISGDSTNRVLSYHNRYLFEMGYAIPTENLAACLGGVFNMFLPKMPIEYEGPEYDGDNNEGYTFDELQTLLAHMQDEMVVILNEVTAADKENKKNRERKKPEVEFGTNTIRELLPNMLGDLDDRKMAIYLAAINDNPNLTHQVSGVISEDGKRTYGTEDGVVISWDEFLDSVIKVGNIKAEL